MTVETAFAALGLAVALVLCAGFLALGLGQAQCSDAAAQIARQAARDDLAAVRAIEDRLPDGVRVSIDRHGDAVVVTVSRSLRPWGALFPAFPLQGRATVTAE